jgi:hypothetical protein
MRQAKLINEEGYQPPGSSLFLGFWIHIKLTVSIKSFAQEIDQKFSLLQVKWSAEQLLAPQLEQLLCFA